MKLTFLLSGEWGDCGPRGSCPVHLAQHLLLDRLSRILPLSRFSDVIHIIKLPCRSLGHLPPGGKRPEIVHIPYIERLLPEVLMLRGVNLMLLRHSECLSECGWGEKLPWLRVLSRLFSRLWTLGDLLPQSLGGCQKEAGRFLMRRGTWRGRCPPFRAMSKSAWSSLSESSLMWMDTRLSFVSGLLSCAEDAILNVANSCVWVCVTLLYTLL